MIQGHQLRRKLSSSQRRTILQKAKLIRSFVSQCASAYAAGKLDEISSRATEIFKSTKSEIQAANVTCPPNDYQAFFHKAYCRMIGKDIPIEKVWAHPKRSPSKNQKYT